MLGEAVTMAKVPLPRPRTRSASRRTGAGLTKPVSLGPDFKLTHYPALTPGTKKEHCSQSVLGVKAG